jgi:hypothetical protein
VRDAQEKVLTYTTNKLSMAVTCLRAALWRPSSQADKLRMIPAARNCNNARHHMSATATMQGITCLQLSKISDVQRPLPQMHLCLTGRQKVQIQSKKDKRVHGHLPLIYLCCEQNDKMTMKENKKVRRQ